MLNTNKCYVLYERNYGKNALRLEANKIVG